MGDQDQNGAVTRAELLSAIKGVEDSRLSEAFVQYMVSQLEGEISHTLHFDEFRKLVHEEGGRERVEHKNSWGFAACNVCCSKPSKPEPQKAAKSPRGASPSGAS